MKILANGLIIDEKSNTYYGIIVDFKGQAYSSDRSVGALTPDQIAQHNTVVAELAWQGMLTEGRGVLYLTGGPAKGNPYRPWEVTDCNGTHKIRPDRVRRSLVATPGSWQRVERYDVRFRVNGEAWYGRNQGDNQLLRVRRVKG